MSPPTRTRRVMSTQLDHSSELLKNPDSLEKIRLYVSSYSGALPTLAALGNSTTVTEVWLESPEDDEKVGLICREALSRCCSLETLTLELSECSNNGIKEVAKVISKKGSKLNKIVLRLNNVSEEGAGHLAQALLRSSVSDFEICATQLDHHDQHIGEKGVALICEAATLADGSCRLASLGFIQNRIESDGLTPIIKLLEPNNTLLKLNLHSNMLDSQASNMLAAKLSQKECRLRHLILDGNSMIKDLGASTIALSLHTNVFLEILSLRSCSISKDGAESLAIALCNNKHLKGLILDGNVEIHNEGTECMAQGVKGNSSLELLDMSSCSVGDSGCSALASSLMGNKTLTSLLLRKNEISTGGVLALSHALSTQGSQ